VGVFATLFFLIVAIRLQQYVLRARSERLLGQVRALDLGGATFADSQRVFQQWPSARDQGPCVPMQCDFEIGISDLSAAHQRFWPNHPQLWHAYVSLGGRPSLVTARVSVHDGVVWSKFFRVVVAVSPHEMHPFNPYGYELIGEARTVQAPNAQSWSTETSHSQYHIGQPGGCEICVMVYTEFTPYAKPTDIQRLMQFDLSCLTRWRSPCRTQADIMPAAWKQVQSERSGPRP
jgi:hypothetical protein